MTKLLVSPLAAILLFSSMVTFLEATTMENCRNKTIKQTMQIPPYE